MSASASSTTAYQQMSASFFGEGGFGRLLNDMWKIKKSTSSKVSNKTLDKIYDKGIKAGALGGKLLGAGNGGFLLFYVKKENKKFLSTLKKII